MRREIIHPSNLLTNAAGHKITGRFRNRQDSWDNVQNSCSYSSVCASTTANGSGAFTLASPRVLLRGDYINYLSIYDAEGNYQIYWDISSAAITASVGSSYVKGYWTSPYLDVTITLRNSEGGFKDAQSASVWRDGSFSIYMAEIINAGDTITVTDGSRTETMRVADLRAALNKDTEQLTIYAPNGNAIVNFNDSRPREDSYYSMCSPHQIVNNTTSISLGAVSSQDSATIDFRGADGHYTYRYTHASSLHVGYGGFVYGYTSPNRNVTVKLLNGNTVIETKSTVSSSSGHYYIDFENDPVPGYRVQVLADKTEEMSVPNVTLNRDVVGNRFYGSSPANQPVQVGLQTRQGYGYTSIRKLINADSNGNYSASFAGEVFISRCEAANVGGQCAEALIKYYDANEFEFYRYGEFRKDVSADAWEDDNSIANAKNYTGYQKHTFHYDDSEDWIKLTVNAGDVGKPFYLMTTNLGPTMDTVLYLYESDGTTLIAKNDDSGGGHASQISWTPTKSGTYYIKVQSFNLNNVGNCGSSYDFFIAHDKVFLPLTVR